MLIDSAEANEKSRARGSQTGSTDPVLAEERYKFFMDRLETMDIDVPYLKTLFQEQDQKCPISDIELHMSDKTIKDKEDWRWCLCPSLDRLDNELGYVQGNVAIVARFVNVGFKDFKGDRDIVAGILFRDEPRPLIGIEKIAEPV
tara:strand:- start:1118 stop:1552 length:435 start_codon:yes stop_codon:yes gene_type:complete